MNFSISMTLLRLVLLGVIIGILFVVKKANYGYIIISVSGSLLLSTIFYYSSY